VAGEFRNITSGLLPRDNIFPVFGAKPTGPNGQNNTQRKEFLSPMKTSATKIAIIVIAILPPVILLSDYEFAEF